MNHSYINYFQVEIILQLFTDNVSKLGPATFGEDNLYQYAVVWSPNYYNAFILARDVQNFNMEYKEEVTIFIVVGILFTNICINKVLRN